MEFVEKKKVNIFPRHAITNVNPPIRTPMEGVTKSVKDIRFCILADAKVEEVLPGGVKVLLNLTNYNIDNSGAKPAVAAAPAPKKAPKPVEEKKPEPKKEEKPVEELKVEEKPVESEPKKEAAVNAADNAEKPESVNQPSHTNENKPAEEFSKKNNERREKSKNRMNAEKAADAAQEKVEVKDPEE